MERSDLFFLAEANRDEIVRRFEDKRRSADPHLGTRIDAFLHLVSERGTVSVNMSAQKLGSFLRMGCHLNPHEIARERAAISGRSAEDELRDLQGAYYERRIAFDRAFEDGERFRYGALNIGGMGAPYYGKFCVVFGIHTLGSWRSAFLPGNSLELYVAASSVPRVDLAGIQHDVAPAVHRHHLAALKHAGDLSHRDEAGWTVMLCSNGCFVEAIFVGDASPSGVAEIRVEKAEVARLYDMIFDDMRGTLDEDAQCEISNFQEILAKLDELGISSRLTEV